MSDNELVPFGVVHVAGPRIFDAYGRPVFVEPIPEKPPESSYFPTSTAGEWYDEDKDSSWVRISW